VVLRRLAPGDEVRAGGGLRLRAVRGDEAPDGVQQRLMVFNVKDRTMTMQDLDEAPVSKQALWMLPTYP
jgi:hypothetical protein